MEDWHWVAVGVASITFLVYWLASRQDVSASTSTSVTPSSSRNRAIQVSPAIQSERGADGVPPSAASDKKLDLPRLAFEDDDELDPTLVGKRTTGVLSPPTAK